MFSCKAFLSAVALSALAFPALATDLDLSYPQPPLAVANPVAPAAESNTPALKLQFKPSISFEHSCVGQCSYETDISQLHERDTRYRSSIGFD